MIVLSLNMCACPCLRGDGYEGAVTNIHNWRYKQPLKEKERLSCILGNGLPQAVMGVHTQALSIMLFG